MLIERGPYGRVRQAGVRRADDVFRCGRRAATYTGSAEAVKIRTADVARADQSLHEALSDLLLLKPSYGLPSWRTDRIERASATWSLRILEASVEGIAVWLNGFLTISIYTVAQLRNIAGIFSGHHFERSHHCSRLLLGVSSYWPDLERKSSDQNDDRVGPEMDVVLRCACLLLEDIASASNQYGLQKNTDAAMIRGRLMAPTKIASGGAAGRCCPSAGIEVLAVQLLCNQ